MASRSARKTFNTPGDAHELTFSCYRRKALLRNTRTRQWSLDAVEAARKKYRFDLWAYVIMPEHVHLLIWPRQETYSMSAIGKHIKQSVSRKALAYLRKHNPDGLKRLECPRSDKPRYRFWQRGPGYDRNLFTPKAIHSSLNYIHNNPVTRCLVEMPTDWEWCSAKWYAGIEGSRIRIDTCPVVKFK